MGSGVIPACSGLCAMQSIMELRAAGCGVQAWLPPNALPALTSLDLCGNPVAGAGLFAALASGRLAALHLGSAAIHQCDGMAGAPPGAAQRQPEGRSCTGAALATMPSHYLAGLTQLSLTDCSCLVRCAHQQGLYVALPRMTALRELTVRAVALPHMGLGPLLSALPPGLKLLLLDGAASVSKQDLAKLVRLPALRALHIVRTAPPLQDGHATVLATVLRGAAALHMLHVDGNRLSVRGVCALATGLQQLKVLHVVNFSACQHDVLCAAVSAEQPHLQLLL